MRPQGNPNRQKINVAPAVEARNRFFASKKGAIMSQEFPLIRLPAPLHLVADILTDALAGPSADEMDAAPLIDIWQPVLTPSDELCLTGRVTAHPRLGSDPRWVVTSSLLLMDRSGGWCRTMSRFYRLGRLAEIRGLDMPPAVRFLPGSRTVDADHLGLLLGALAVAARTRRTE